MTAMKDECLICGAPLVYPETSREMECAICGKKELADAHCAQGHYVCNECHMNGIDSIFALCLSETSKDPHHILCKLMALPFCHMHGPEHHILVGASLLTAYKNAGGDLDLPKALRHMQERGKKVPGGICGFWGSCGAAVSTGIFVGAVTSSTPLTEDSWGLANRMTAASLQAVGEIGGPRCCKRNSYTAIGQAVAFCRAHFGVELEYHVPVCSFFGENAQCIGKRCPYHPVNHRTR